MRHAVVAGAITALALGPGAAAYVLTQPDRTVVPIIEVKPVLEDTPKVEKKKAEKPAKKKARAEKSLSTGSSGGSAPALSPVVPAGNNGDDDGVARGDDGGDD
jgi:hypothetical protein